MRSPIKTLLVFTIAAALRACHPSDGKTPRITAKKNLKESDLSQTDAELICEKFLVTENFYALKQSRIDALVSFGIERKAAKVIEHLLATKYAKGGDLNTTDCMYLLINNKDLDPILVRAHSSITLAYKE